MSLINDALKRAQESQKQAPPPMPGAPLHSTARKKSPLCWIAIGIAVVILLLVVEAVMLLKWNSHKVAQPKIATVQPKPSTPKIAPQNSTPPPSPEPVAPVKNIPTTLREIPSVPTNPVAVVAETNPTPPVAVIQTPQPTDLQSMFKLQGIFYRPDRPSCVINGNTLFLNETFFVDSRLGDARVIAITRDSATLVVGGQTNILRQR